MTARCRVLALASIGLVALVLTGANLALADGMSEEEWRGVESGTATQPSQPAGEAARFQPVTNFESTAGDTTAAAVTPETAPDTVETKPENLEGEDERLIELEREMLRKLSTLQNRSKPQ